MWTILKIIIWVALGLGVLWWLSGHDPQVKGENRLSDFIRRTLRCLLTLILASVFFLPNAVHAGYAFIPLILIVPPSIGVLWASCIGGLFAQGVHHVIDSDDRRKFDPDQGAHNLERVAGLLNRGQHEEAVKLCEELKKSGDANVLALETLLARAGIHQENPRRSNPLTEAHQLRAQGKFGEAEAILRSLLVKNPSDADAALMLMRLYAQDMRRSDKAAEILRWFEKQPHVPAATVEFARRSIHEWSQQKTEPAAVPLPESVDELLASGYLGTAIEMLENKTREQPRDFDSWLKLAEAHGRRSGNLHRAEKIVKQIGSNPAFTPEQIQLAKTRLEEWRAAKPKGG